MSRTAPAAGALTGPRGSTVEVVMRVFFVARTIPFRGAGADSFSNEKAVAVRDIPDVCEAEATSAKPTRWTEYDSQTGEAPTACSPGSTPPSRAEPATPPVHCAIPVARPPPPPLICAVPRRRRPATGEEKGDLNHGWASARAIRRLAVHDDVARRKRFSPCVQGSRGSQREQWEQQVQPRSDPRRPSAKTGLLCSSCHEPIDEIRCWPLEKPIAAGHALVPFAFAEHGCMRPLGHSSATKRMCVCPLPCCGYASLKLRDRIQGTHAVAAPSGGGDHVVVSLVGSPEVMLRHRTPFVVLLQETDVCVLLLLNGGNVSSGLSLSVVCVGPRLGGNKSLEYELQDWLARAVSVGARGVRRVHTHLGGAPPNGGFLLVPDTYWNSSGAVFAGGVGKVGKQYKHENDSSYEESNHATEKISTGMLLTSRRASNMHGAALETRLRKEEGNHHVEDGAEVGQKKPRPVGLGHTEPAGLAYSEAQWRPPFTYARCPRQP
nr:unnamed protein product [Digitaria exilis]